jgi:D-inositol-3-phosphate glycosyltransferase
VSSKKIAKHSPAPADCRGRYKSNQFEEHVNHSSDMPAGAGQCIECGEKSREHGARIAMLTGGKDRHYSLDLAGSLLSMGIRMDFIGSDEHIAPELSDNDRVRFLNLRRSTRQNSTVLSKIGIVCSYYAKLLRYAAFTDARLFHILWNNKFDVFDRTLLMLYYKLLGKRIAFTAHNVNAGTRDGNDSWLNRMTLKMQYRLCNHIFVHTEKMKAQLTSDFGVHKSRVSVIPHGINNKIPTTDLNTTDAKRHFGIKDGEKTLLLFGNLAPYKGLEYLMTAFIELSKKSADYRLIIAGRSKASGDYWSRIKGMISASGLEGRIIQHIQFIPDGQMEFYFKAADVLVLPYTHIFQSGVLFLGYSFGLPVIASDVGALKEEIIEGRTGFVCRPQDSTDLAETIERYFASDLYRNLEARRQSIREYAKECYSWTKAASITASVYAKLLEN